MRPASLALLFLCLALTACGKGGFFVPDNLTDEEWTPRPPPTPPVEGSNLRFELIVEDVRNLRGLVNPMNAELWVRLKGTGLEQDRRRLRAGLYDVGPNGAWERGMYDDRLVYVVHNVEWAIADWQMKAKGDGTPPTLDPDGTFRAGGDTGTALVQAHNDTWGVAEAPVLVTAPDWCPGRFDCLEGN